MACNSDDECVLALLQDQLGPAVAGAFPDAAHFVLSAKQLMASSITPVCSSSLRSVLVYGADLHAFDALATLIEAGVDAGGSFGKHTARLEHFMSCAQDLLLWPSHGHTRAAQCN